MSPDHGSKPHLSREEVARTEVGHTTIAVHTARALVFIFLIAVAAVPVLELLTAGSNGRAATAWTHLARLPAQVRAQLAADDVRDAGVWTRVISANRTALAGLNAFEDALDDESRLGRRLRPNAQRFLSGRLGAGNERVYVGRDGWLFYRPDVEYATGPAFLSPAQLARRAAEADEWIAAPQPDPRVAIRDFKLQLDRLGITLVVVPTPVKPGVHPEKLSARMTHQSAPVHNASYARFLDEVRRDGILVFDASDVLDALRLAGLEATYLATDTHWRPETVQAVAEALAEFIQEYVPLARGADAGYRTEWMDVSHEGDTLVMLDLPPEQTRYRAETVRTRRVLGPDGSPWTPSRQADVLLLGDSFTNIYALDTMGWGNSAGLAEQLSHALNRPLDRIVQNDDGAFATRAMLARTAATDPDRLARTRLVIWQFAARELAFGDWRPIEIPR